MTKVIKKKKLRILPFFIFVIVIAIIVFACSLFLNSKIKNIIIVGNNVISDDEIISKADIVNYPSFYKTLSINIENKLEDIPIIKKVNVKRKFYHIFQIEIEEYKVLFKNQITGKYILENKEEITFDKELPYMVPRLINEIPKDKYDLFIKYFKRIDVKTREKISEIKYEPNEYDKDRFLLYMDDGNSVYLTITKFERLNYYSDVLSQLEGRKGILYLDSGNHFKVME